MLCISLDNFKTNQRFWIMKIKLFLETILGQTNSCECVNKTLRSFWAFPKEIYK